MFCKYKLKILKDPRAEKLSFDCDGRNHYIYRITNLNTLTHYYGSRVTKLNPHDDIGIKYFSSSYDKHFIKEQKENPKNFKYKVVKTFNNTGDNILYESYLHEFHNVGKNSKFINKTIQCPFGFNPTGNKESAIKIKKTKSKINPNTGLTGYQESAIKMKNTLNSVNPKSGLTRAKEIGLKSQKTNSKINPDTGLTGYQTTGLKIKEIHSTVNPVSGLTGYQINGSKSKKTKSQINPTTGLTGYQHDSIKIKKTKSKINPNNGLTGYQESAIKMKNTLNSINPKSGLTRAEEIGLKTSMTLNLKQKSGLTRAEEIGLKTSMTLNLKQKSGLTRAEEIGLKNQGINHYSYKGYYMFNGIKYVNPVEIADITGVSVKTIRTWCKNSDKIIKLINLQRCQYLNNLGPHIIGKSFLDIGFHFIYITS